MIERFFITYDRNVGAIMQELDAVTPWKVNAHLAFRQAAQMKADDKYRKVRLFKIKLDLDGGQPELIELVIPSPATIGKVTS